MSAPFVIRPLLAVTLLSLLAAPRLAFGLDQFEIQVYEDDVNKPGQLGLEVHTNFTFSGRKTPDYAGEIPPHHIGRLTLEPALGVTDFLELGAYIQFYTSPDKRFDFAGLKLRTKWVVPERWRWPLMLGLNVELGKVSRAVEQDGWANEFRPIIGWKNDHFLASFNPIFGYALTGDEAFEPDFEPAGKLAWNTQRGFALGVEYFACLAHLTSGFHPLKEQEHVIYAIFDLAEPAGSETDDGWEFNLGLGRALTDITGAQWIAKMIVGKPF